MGEIACRESSLRYHSSFSPEGRVSTTHEPTPTSLIRLGHARRDITPPVGIYHRMWGAARHDRASGVHRPILADILVFEPAGKDPAQRLVRVLLDLVGLTNPQQDPVRSALADRASVPIDHVVITYSHSHASGVFNPGRQALPGGEMIAPYLRDLSRTLGDALTEAIESLDACTITYAQGRCSLAGNRDYFDTQRDIYATGYNPDADADDTVATARVVDPAGKKRLTLVHYACHPTTLSWDNTSLSPDFVGAARQVVEDATTCPCLYLQGACGDLGPRDGFTGELATADRNGRQLGYAALSALSSLGPPETDFVYEGPVVSGATLGVWRHREMDADHRRTASAFNACAFSVDLPLIDLPTAETLRTDLERYTNDQQKADEVGDVLSARDLGARAERCRRWLGRVEHLPGTGSYPLACTIWRFGDAVWVTCGGEPYSAMQTSLRARFPGRPILLTPIAGDTPIAYLLPRDRYGKGLYQEEPSSLAPGCLETLIERVATAIERLLEG